MDTADRAVTQDRKEDTSQLDLSKPVASPPKRKPPSTSSRNKTALVDDIEAWTPPDFGDQRRTRIGASIVDQFVAGHTASDVLRELVQNEFDGGGDRLVVTFGRDALEVAGNGGGISADGWNRLSVIVGTGRVVGEDAAGRIAPKTNGIGWLCCTNPVKDSSRESSMVAGVHEQTHIPDLQDQELASL